jgi:branched-chain amino acid transport system ATP-binding protein
MTVLLEVKNLSVNYGKAKALKDISFSVAKGEALALIGANGAGKTTIMKSISGLVRPAAGEMWYKGKPLSKLPPYERVRLGIAHIPEGRRVFSALSIQQNLEVGAYTQENKGQVGEQLEKMYVTFPILKERRRQPAGTLSGGQQQMLAIARALMSAPELLLMDEPSLGLSPLVVQEVSHIIREIAQGGTSIILVEQNALLALTIAARGYVIEVGSIVLEGAALELLNNESLKEAYFGV